MISDKNGCLLQKIMIKVAVIGGSILSGVKKNLVRENFRNIDKPQVQMDIVCNDDSNLCSCLM